MNKIDVVELRARCYVKAIEKHESRYSDLHFTKEQMKKDYETWIDEPLKVVIEYVINVINSSQNSEKEVKC